jgi:hypothetical protein
VQSVLNRAPVTSGHRKQLLGGGLGALE